ncbi:DUF6301 family protein [Nocardia thailandica]|uniref:DUF6301 family protein n=1 Tax=Nocardia thailandica TaxID=257275 RepID=UPI0002D5A866|nr:DUF6301 family protein [Nocardia thailandica]
MTEWQTTPAPEVAALATRLRDLDWSWQLADAPRLAAEFGWRVVSERPGWVMLDTGFGTGSGTIFADDGRVERIEIRVTGYAEDTEAGRTLVRDASAELEEAIEGALGAPTARVVDDPVQIRWAGAGATLVQARQELSVWLWLVTNEALAADDRDAEVDVQGLL